MIAHILFGIAWVVFVTVAWGAWIRSQARIKTLERRAADAERIAKDESSLLRDLWERVQRIKERQVEMRYHLLQLRQECARRGIAGINGAPDLGEVIDARDDLNRQLDWAGWDTALPDDKQPAKEQ